MKPNRLSGRRDKKPKSTDTSGSGSSAETPERSDVHSRSTKTSYKIEFEVHLKVMLELSDLLNGVTLQLKWKELKSRNTSGITQVNIAKGNMVSWNERLVFTSKLYKIGNTFNPCILHLGLYKAGEKHTIDKGSIKLHELTEDIIPRDHQVTFDKATPKQIGNQVILGRSQNKSKDKDSDHKVVSHGIEWDTRTATNLTMTDNLEGSLSDDEDLVDFNEVVSSIREKPSTTMPGPSTLAKSSEIDKLQATLHEQTTRIQQQERQIDYLMKEDEKNQRLIRELKKGGATRVVGEPPKPVEIIIEDEKEKYETKVNSDAEKSNKSEIDLTDIKKELSDLKKENQKLRKAQRSLREEAEISMFLLTRIYDVDQMIGVQNIHVYHNACKDKIPQVAFDLFDGLVELNIFRQPNEKLLDAIPRSILRKVQTESVSSMIYWISTVSAFYTYCHRYQLEHENSMGSRRMSQASRTPTQVIHVFLGNLDKCLHSLCKTLIGGFVKTISAELPALMSRQFSQLSCLNVVKEYFTQFSAQNLVPALKAELCKALMRSINNNILNTLLSSPMLIKPTTGQNLQVNISFMEEWLDNQTASMALEKDLVRQTLIESKEASKLLQFPVQSPDDVLLVAEHLNVAQVNFLLSNWQQDQLVPVPLGVEAVTAYKQKTASSKAELTLPKIATESLNLAYKDETFMEQFF